MLVYHSVEKSITIALIRIAIADNSKTTVKIFRNIIFERYFYDSIDVYISVCVIILSINQIAIYTPRNFPYIVITLFKRNYVNSINIYHFTSHDTV